MLYMIIEHFDPGIIDKVGERFREKGRMMPDGVEYVSSWMTPDGSACYQVMKSPTELLLNKWIANWEDLVKFEVIPIQTSSEFWENRG